MNKAVSSAAVRMFATINFSCLNDQDKLWLMTHSLSAPETHLSETCSTWSNLPRMVALTTPTIPDVTADHWRFWASLGRTCMSSFIELTSIFASPFSAKFQEKRPGAFAGSPPRKKRVPGARQLLLVCQTSVAYQGAPIALNSHRSIIPLFGQSLIKTGPSSS